MNKELRQSVDLFNAETARVRDSAFRMGWDGALIDASSSVMELLIIEANNQINNGNLLQAELLIDLLPKIASNILETPVRLEKASPLQSK